MNSILTICEVLAMNTAIDPAQRLARWRLILGAQAQERLERMGACGLTEEQLLMDQALGAIYGCLLYTSRCV